MVDEDCDVPCVVSEGVDTAPTVVGTGGGIGIGVVLAAVEAVKDPGTSIAVAAIKFPNPEGKKCTVPVE